MTHSVFGGTLNLALSIYLERAAIKSFNDLQGWMRSDRRQSRSTRTWNKPGWCERRRTEPAVPPPSCHRLGSAPSLAGFGSLDTPWLIVMMLLLQVMMEMTSAPAESPLDTLAEIHHCSTRFYPFSSFESYLSNEVNQTA